MTIESQFGFTLYENVEKIYFCYSTKGMKRKNVNKKRTNVMLKKKGTTKFRLILKGSINSVMTFEIFVPNRVKDLHQCLTHLTTTFTGRYK